MENNINMTVKDIMELATPHNYEFNGINYSDKPLHAVKNPKVDTLAFHSLDGLVQAIIAEHEKFIPPMIVCVDDEERVSVYSAICDDRGREMPYHCHAELVHIAFNEKLSYEAMMIMLRSKFVETPELLEVVKLLGTITEENSAQVSDDGFTQNVVVRKGIAMKEGKTVNPIVRLKPYRTFNEVDQPESEFLLRLSEGGKVALYEADGGAWKMTAQHYIADYLRGALEPLVESKTVLVVE